MEAQPLPGVDSQRLNTIPEVQISVDANRHAIFRFNESIVSTYRFYDPRGNRHTLEVRVDYFVPDNPALITLIPDNGRSTVIDVSLEAGELMLTALED